MNPDLPGQARWLINAIAAGLSARNGPGLDEVLERLAQQDLTKLRDCPARQLPVCRLLPETVAAAMMVDPSLAAAAAACVDELEWRHTAGYSDSLLGEGFMDNYGHCELIGPYGVFPGEDFLLGLLILGPLRHYRDHYHPAPELYWPLTGPSRWKQGSGGFETKQAGETVWHEANIVHATQTGEEALLAVWAWTRDTAIRARLVAA